MMGARWFSIVTGGLFLALAGGLCQTQPLYQRRLDDAAKHVAEDLVQAGRLKVAVCDLPNRAGAFSEFSQVLADQLGQSLQHASERLELLDRANLRKLLDEHELVKRGLTDPEMSAHLQILDKLIPANVVVTGRLTPMRDSVSISIRALELPTLKVLSSASFSVARTPSVDELLSHLLPGGQK